MTPNLTAAFGPTLARKLARIGPPRELVRASVEALMGAGLTEAQAIRVHAVFALAVEGLAADEEPAKSIDGALDAWRWFLPHMRGLPVEEFHALYLTRRNRVLRHVMISRGNDNCTVVDPRMVLRPAIELGATSVIVAHNHPSGDPEPSEQDRAVTTRLVQACRVVGVRLLDHIILAGKDFRSFADRGYLPAHDSPAVVTF